MVARRVGSSIMRALPVLLALLALAPLAPAQDWPQAEVVVLAYHPHPDPRAGRDDADPFSSASAPPPEDLAVLDHGALRLPATRLDGVLRVSDAPEGDPASALAHFREAQRLLLLRQRTGAPVAIEIAGTQNGAALDLEMNLAPAAALGNASLEARVVVFEDAVPDPAAPRLHRFVVRHVEPAEPVDLSRATRLTRSIPLDPAWSIDRVAVAVFIAYVGAEGGRFMPGEVLQAASWRVGQAGPTVQVEKAVLVEALTATWCDACRPTEESIALVASQFGASGLESPVQGYDVRPGALALGGLVTGLGAGVLLLRRRAA